MKRISLFPRTLVDVIFIALVTIGATSFDTPRLGAASIAEPRAADELYPCRASTTVMRSYHIESDAPDVAAMKHALTEIGAEIAYGPRASAGRPGRSFLVVRTPRTATAETLASALRKGGALVEPLSAVAFEGRTGEDHELTLIRMSKRDIVLGMSGDVRWYDTSGTWSQLHGRIGKLDPTYFMDRYEKLNRPYGRARLGEVARESFTWTLAAAPDTQRRASLRRRIRQIDGVEQAVIVGEKLTVSVILRDLEVCGDVGHVPAGEALDGAGSEAPRVAFDAGEVFELLRTEGLVR